jgi:uncharacterized protein (DUF1810 family)
MPLDLARFVDAQKSVYEQVLAELREGKKESHWMWFVFPQASGLGSSMNAKRFAVSDLEGARLYLRDPLLGRRLRQCTRLVLTHREKALTEIFGPIDSLKFVSSMTLFDLAASRPNIFFDALQAFNGGNSDEMTLRLLHRSAARRDL